MSIATASLLDTSVYLEPRASGTGGSFGIGLCCMLGVACQVPTTTTGADHIVEVQGPSVPQNDLSDQLAQSRSGAVLSTAEQLQFAREQLSLNVTELANILHVQRPTIYAWRDGTEPHPENQQRLEDLYKVAKAWEELSDTPVGRRRRRRLKGQPTLLEALSEGGQPLAAVQGLLRQLSSISVPRSASQIAAERGFEKPSEEQQLANMAQESTSIADLSEPT